MPYNYADNFFYGKIPADPWSLITFKGTWSATEKNNYKQIQSFSRGIMVTESPLEAFNSVLSHTDASISRDVVDIRVIGDTENGSGSLIDTQSEVDCWSVYNTSVDPADIDMDGMPVEWETEIGLNKDDPEDRNGDLDNYGYSFLEGYLNSLVLFNPVSTIKITKKRLFHLFVIQTQ